MPRSTVQLLAAEAPAGGVFRHCCTVLSTASCTHGDVAGHDAVYSKSRCDVAGHDAIYSKSWRDVAERDAIRRWCQVKQLIETLRESDIHNQPSGVRKVLTPPYRPRLASPRLVRCLLLKKQTTIV